MLQITLSCNIQVKAERILSLPFHSPFYILHILRNFVTVGQHLEAKLQNNTETFYLKKIETIVGIPI